MEAGNVWLDGKAFLRQHWKLVCSRAALMRSPIHSAIRCLQAQKVLRAQVAQILLALTIIHGSFHTMKMWNIQAPMVLKPSRLRQSLCKMYHCGAEPAFAKADPWVSGFVIMCGCSSKPQPSSNAVSIEPCMRLIHQCNRETERSLVVHVQPTQGHQRVGGETGLHSPAFPLIQPHWLSTVMAVASCESDSLSCFLSRCVTSASGYPPARVGQGSCIHRGFPCSEP